MEKYFDPEYCGKTLNRVLGSWVWCRVIGFFIIHIIRHLIVDHCINIFVFRPRTCGKNTKREDSSALRDSSLGSR